MTIEERLAHLAFAESSEENKAAFKLLLQDRELGDAFFINVCCFTFDPRRDKSGEVIGPVPFLLWPRQEEVAQAFGHAMDNSYDIGGEKSRDVGFTWIVLCCLVRRWLFEPNFSALVGHYTEDLLDSADDSSLFWRMKFILKYLPGWLLPQGFNLDSKEWSQFAKLTNGTIGSAITGASPTARFGVGARKTVIYWDDFARWEWGAQSYASCAQTTRCRITTWTVNPDKPQNHAYELRFGKGIFAGTRTRIVNCSWRDDPRKAEIAYEKDDLGNLTPYNIWLRDEIGDVKLGIPGRISIETFKREYEINYELQTKGKIYGEQMPHVRIGRFPYDPRFPLYTAVDNGVGDECVILWIQWDFERFRYRIVDCYHSNGQGASYYAPILLGRKSSSEILEHEADYDDEAWRIIGRNTGRQRLDRRDKLMRVPYAGHFGDPAVKNRGSSDGKSFKAALWESTKGEVNILTNDFARTIAPRLEESRRILRYTDIDESIACEYIRDCLNNYRWNKLGTAPEHDEFSHGASAFQYYSVNDPHKEEFQDRAKILSRGTAQENMACFGDLSALPEHIRREILGGALTDPFDLRTGNTDNAQVYSPAQRDAMPLSRYEKSLIDDQNIDVRKFRR